MCQYLGLECTPQSHYERIFCKREDVPLVKHLLDLFLHDHAVLADLLHGKPLARILVSYQVDSTVVRDGGTFQCDNHNICTLKSHSQTRGVLSITDVFDHIPFPNRCQDRHANLLTCSLTSTVLYASLLMSCKLYDSTPTPKTKN